MKKHITKAIIFMLSLIMIITAMAAVVSANGETYTVTVSGSGIGMVAGGGDYAAGETVTVTAYSRTGYAFKGWYEASDMATILSTRQIFSFIVEKDTDLVAVYEADKTNQFSLSVNAPKFTLNGDPTVQEGYIQGRMFRTGDTIVLEYVDTSNDFLYWVNSNGNIISTSPRYVFTMTNDISINCYYVSKSVTGSTAKVFFRNAYKQIISSMTYSTVSFIDFPAQAPSKMGYTFSGWYIADENGDASSTEATNDTIHSAMAESGIVLVVPAYAKNGNSYAVNVEYTDGTASLKTPDVADIPVGDMKTFTAPAISGKVFRHWEIDGKIVGYEKKYTIMRANTCEVELKAVYGDSAEEKQPLISIIQSYARKNGVKYTLSHTLQYYVPEGYEVIESGFVYGTKTATFGTDGGENTLKIGRENVSKHVSGYTGRDVLYTFNGTLSKPTTVLYIRAYVIYMNEAGAVQDVLYTPVVAKSYYDITGSVTGLVPVIPGGSNGTTTQDITIYTDSASDPDALAVIPAGTAVDEGSVSANDTAEFVLSITETSADTGSIVLGTSYAAKGYDISVEGVSSSNSSLIIVHMKAVLDTGLSGITVYHDGVPMTSASSVTLSAPDTFWYDSETGDVVFCTTGFSNYTLTYKMPDVTVSFVNEDGDELLVTSVPYGSIPEYTGETPVKADDELYTYTFDKWVPEISAVTEDTTYTATYTSESKIRYATFDHSDNFANVDVYLYRVGNGNTVKLGSLFSAVAGDSDIVSANVRILIEAVENDSTVAGNGTGLESGSSAKCTYTKNTSDWKQSTLKFTGEGPVKVTIWENIGQKYILNLEVVNGNNATSAASATSANVVLLNDVSTAGISVSKGKTLYGNGFTVTDTRTNTAVTSGFVALSGTVDNVKFVGYEPTTAVVSGVTNQGYAPIVRVSGNDAVIYNSYISGGRYALMLEDNDAYLYNTMIDGGAIANIQMDGGNVVLENCTTTKSSNGGLYGLGIQVTSGNGSISLKGTFKQYNWLTDDYLPSPFGSILTSVYNDPEYAYTYDERNYVNVGILFLNESQDISAEDVQRVISDSTGNDYGYIEKRALGHTGTVYTAKSSMGTPEMTGTPAGFTGSQYYTLPTFTFDYTTKNYIPKTEGSVNYCYYDSTTGKVNISFEKTDSDTVMAWDPMILTSKKYNQPLNYTVSMNGVDYTNGMISFAESGDYTIVYTISDPYNYDKDCVKYPSVYEREVKITVTAAEPGSDSYNAFFTYTGDWENAARKVIGTDNKTYVMPDISGTGELFGSTTVAGQTVYYPIVSVGPTSSNGNEAYASGAGYYFAPVFNALNITDYDQTTGAVLYTYDMSSTTWPHGKSASNGPDSNVFGYANGAAYANQPYARPMNAQYYKFGKNNMGLCYTSTAIEKDNAASTHLVQYYYVSNDGETYYWYIQYSFAAMTYESCIAEGTMITLSDGTQKAVENVCFDDKILSWNFFTGEFESEEIALLVDHGLSENTVLNLIFSDGTALRIIGDHGIFDMDQNRFVYLNSETYADYIGHGFAKHSRDGYDTVTLIDATVTTEEIHTYSITSAYNSNAFAEGLLTIAPPEKFYNWIEMGDTLRYDTDKFNADLAAYGTYDYSVFADYVTEKQFEQWNGAYLKIAVESGKITFEEIVELINTYRKYMMK